MPLRTITGNVAYANGTNPTNSRVEFYLNGIHIDEVTIAHSQVFVPVASNGDIVAQLYPNAGGFGANRYNVDLVNYQDAQYTKEIRRVNLGRIYVENTTGQVLQTLLTTFTGPSEPLPAATAAAAAAAASAAAASASASAAAGVVDLRTYESIAALKAVSSPINGKTYRVSNSAFSKDYVWQTGAIVPEDTIKWTVVSSTGGRYIAVNGDADIEYWLAMGQSNTVGADPGTTGTVFTANSRVEVWNEVTSTWVVPTAGQEPFNPSGSNNATLAFCNRRAESTGRRQRMIMIADGSQSIEKWTGVAGDRTISVGNRPKWIELQTAMTAIGVGSTVTLKGFIWTQGEADGVKGLSFYSTEWTYLTQQMTAANYISATTPIMVTQIYQGAINSKGNTASSNAVMANAFLFNLQNMGDARLRVVNTVGIPAGLGELTEGTQTAAVHFTDAGLNLLGARILAAYQMAEIGYQHPQDFGLERARDDRGNIDPHLWGGGTVPVNIPNSTVLSVMQVGQTFDLQNGSTITLPDFTHPTAYSTAIRNNIGWCVYFKLTQVGSATINIQSGGTGGIVRLGALYVAGALETSITISAAGASTANQIHMARWTGSRWDFYRITA